MFKDLLAGADFMILKIFLPRNFDKKLPFSFKILLIFFVKFESWHEFLRKTHFFEVNVKNVKQYEKYPKIVIITLIPGQSEQSTTYLWPVK
jgi:hypothetical protein